MLGIFLDRIPALEERWEEYRELFTEISVPAKTTLLKAGEIPTKIFFVRQGALRISFDSKGKDVTLQFFFENEMVASFDSFMNRRESPIAIKAIEPSTLTILGKNGFEILLRDFPEMKDILFEIVSRRFAHYSRLLLSYLRNNPRERYLELLEENPEVVRRVPQQYIASFLGITPVSLSRIRNKIRS